MKTILDGPRPELVRITFDLDKTLAEDLRVMESYTKIPQVQLLETALKRYIASHKDFFPPEKR